MMLSDNSFVIDLAFFSVIVSFSAFFGRKKMAQEIKNIISKFSGGQSHAIDENKENCGKSQNISRSQAVREALRGYDKFFTVINLNLEGIVEDTKNAALTVLGNLSEIRSLFAGVTDFIYQNGEVARTASAQMSMGLIETKELLLALKAFGSRRDMEIAEYKKWLSSFLEGFKNFQGKIGDIEALSLKAEKTASHAAAEAGRMDKEAWKFVSMAREIEALSKQMGMVVGFIQAGMQSMEQNIIQKGARDRFLEKGEEKDRRFEFEVLEQLFGKALSLGGNCSQLAQHHEKLITKMDQMGENIASKVLQSFDEIQFQDRVAQQIEMLTGAISKANSFMEECAKALDPTSDAELKSSMEAIIDSLQEKYVMESQHKHHAEALNQEYQEKEITKVEFF